MARTTDIDVQGIIQVDSCVSLTPFIRTAHVLTNKVAENDEGGLLDNDLLKEIETWLAAHFYAHRDQLYQSKNTGQAGASFQGQTGMMLDSTQYGQTAKMLDITGFLSDIAEGIERPQILWLGNPEDSPRPGYGQESC